jgi:hypothetical protein
MPVGTLLCEGVPGGPDVVLLSALLGGQTLVLPSMGKYGMRNRVLARREYTPSASIFGLLDGDFCENWQPPKGKPSVWTGKDNTSIIPLGWRWERKEIENYLIDPAVVCPLLGTELPDPEGYKRALEAARDSLANYQAARWALSLSRPDQSQLSNEFPRQFVIQLTASVDSGSSVDSYHAQIRSCIKNFQDSKLVDPELVIAQFDSSLLQDCLPGGLRHQHYLHAFAGKDLLRQIAPTLQHMGFRSGAAFLEKVLTAATQYPGDLAALLPEWTALREIIRTS